MEHVATKDGVHYLNDSMATNVNSAWWALETVDAPIIWIAGGTDDTTDYTPLLSTVALKVKAVVTLGQHNAQINIAMGPLDKAMYNAPSVQIAVHYGHRLSEPGDTVLLSPACPDADLLNNYEEQGRQFKSAVGRI